MVLGLNLPPIACLQGGSESSDILTLFVLNWRVNFLYKKRLFDDGDKQRMVDLSKSDIPEKKPFKVWITFDDNGWVVHAQREGQRERTWGPSTYKPEYFSDKTNENELFQALGAETEEERVAVRQALFKSSITSSEPSREDEKEVPEHEEIPSGDYFDENGTFIPKLLADEVLNQYKFVTMMDSQEIYVYLDGYYSL